MTRELKGADLWEVTRHYADGEQSNVHSLHARADLAERAYRRALGEGFYAVDVSFLPHGRKLAFEPLYGTANGFQWHAHEGQAIYSDPSIEPLAKELA
jgi:hypothetical protein